MFDIDAVVADFPALSQTINGEPLCYLDSAATSHKPQVVLNRVTRFYGEQNANVHRGVHTLSQHATVEYENARKNVAAFLAISPQELVWTKGATEAINLVANGLTEQLSTGDVILISELEHHANIVPWQQLAQRTGAKLAAINVTAQGVLDLTDAKQKISQLKPKVLAISHVSNVLGNINPVEQLLAWCKPYGTLTLVDGAQALLHLRPNLTALDCDFYVFSAHKCLGPTGLGGLYGRYNQLEKLAVYQTGGEMIQQVSLNSSTFNPPPSKFEAGTPNIAGVLGFSAAIDYLNQLDKHALQQHEQALYQQLITGLNAIEGIKIWGDCQHNVGVVSFSYQQEHPYDVATLLNGFGVAVRHGHHCAQPLLAALGLNGTVRASLAFYNTAQDITHFLQAMEQTAELLA